MNLTQMLELGRAAGVPGLEELTEPLYQIGRGHHRSRDCKQGEPGALEWFLVLTPTSEKVNLSRAARKKRLCGCVTLSGLAWANRDALSGLEELTNLLAATTALAESVDTQDDPVTLVWNLRQVEEAAERLQREPKSSAAETVRAHALLSAEVETVRARAARKSRRHRSAVEAACQSGLRPASLTEASGEDGLLSAEVLVRLESHWPGKEANLLDAVVTTYEEEPHKGTVLRCPGVVGRWAVHAAGVRRLRAELAELSKDDTEEVLETMWALFTPEERGPLSTLQGALEAARRV